MKLGHRPEQHPRHRNLESAQSDGNCKSNGLILGLVFDVSRSCWNLNDQVDTERLWEQLHTERPMLVVGSPKGKAFREMQSVDQKNPKFRHRQDAGVSHLKALMAVYGWQVGQGNCFSMKILITIAAGTSRKKRVLTKMPIVQVTAKKQLGTFWSSCNPSVEALVTRIKDREAASISFAVFVLQGLRRGLRKSLSS